MPLSLPRAGLSGAVSAGVLAITLIAGCSGSSSEAGSELANPSSAPPSAAAPDDTATPEQAGAAGETKGGDGSAITLNVLKEEDIRQAELPGELGCQFTTEDGQVLLIAVGNVASSEPARGVVKVAGYVESVSAPGGFDGITDSPTFTGKGKTVHIQVAGEPPRRRRVPATAGHLDLRPGRWRAAGLAGRVGMRALTQCGRKRGFSPAKKGPSNRPERSS